MALRTVILEILVQKEMENSQGGCSKDMLTKHLVEFSVLARTFKNTQVKSLQNYVISLLGLFYYSDTSRYNNVKKKYH